MIRDDKWLKQRMEDIWSFLFSDVERKNNVIIKFKGKWKNKFGHIKKLKNKNTEIGINSFFRNEIIPEDIIHLTIAHEIIHYAHGFNSPYTKLFKYPHQGGVVRKELLRRGFGNSIKEEKEFIKKWPDIYKSLIGK